jgi:type IV secretory system conjugative DNA transfer VirD4/TraG family protein
VPLLETLDALLRLWEQRLNDDAGDAPDQPSAAWALDDPLLLLSDHDVFDLRAACQAVLLTGATGSGKSSGPLRACIQACMDQGFGLLLHCTKKGDAEQYVRLATEAGRKTDLRVFSPESDFTYDFLGWECANGSRGGAQVENLVFLLSQLLEVASPDPQGARSSNGQDPFWADARRTLLRATCDVAIAARGSVDVQTIYRAIQSAPRSNEELHSDSFRESSFCYQLLQEAHACDLSESRKRDLEASSLFLLQEWPGLGDKTRSSVQLTTTAFLDSLNRGWLRDIFCSGSTTLPPSVLDEGGIVVLDFPPLELQVLGRLAQTIYKLAFFRHVQARAVSDATRPIAYIADEFTLYSTSVDPAWLQTARSSRTAAFFAIQNLPLLTKAFGSEEAAQAFLGNCCTRIHLVNQCQRTNEWAANSIGKQFSFRGSFNRSENANTQDRETGGSSFGSSSGTSVGGSAQYEYHEDFHPGLFPQLRPGGPPDFTVESFVVRSGAPFSNGKNYLRVNWPQE